MESVLDVSDATCGRLSFGEAVLLAEQAAYIHVQVQQSMASLPTAFFGVIGPFERGTYVAVPLHLARLLAAERIALPQIPPWLGEARLKELVRQESQTETLCPCPHPHYVELAFLFFSSSRNPWAGEPQPHAARENAARLFEDLVAIRAAKVAKYNTSIILEGAAVTTAFSDFERRRLGTIGLDYMKHLTMKSKCLEDLLASMNVLDAEAHYDLLEKAQELCEAALPPEEDRTQGD